MANEAELERISNELSMLQASGEAIRQQMQAMQAAILEVTSALELIDNIKKVKGDALVPIGSGVFISCPKPDPEKIVLSVGSGMLVQKKPDEAMKILQERQKRMSDSLATSQSSLDETIKAIERLTYQASALGAAEERRNVRAPEKQAD